MEEDLTIPVTEIHAVLRGLGAREEDIAGMTEDIQCTQICQQKYIIIQHFLGKRYTLHGQTFFAKEETTNKIISENINHKLTKYPISKVYNNVIVFRHYWVTFGKKPRHCKF